MSESMEVREAPEVLLTGRRLRITRIGDHRLLVRSGSRWVYSLLMFVVCMMMAFGLWICALWIYMAIFHPAPQTEQNVVGFVCGLPCLVFFASMLAATIYLLLTLALPRRTLIDLNTGTIHYHQIPGWSRQMALAEVSTVDLVMFANKGTCHLGFTNGQTGTLHSIHWLGGQFDSALENRNQLLPAARRIAEYISKPLEASWGRIDWSMRKGPSEPLPPA